MRLVFFFIGFYSLSLSLSLHCLCSDMVCGSDLVFIGLIWFVGLGGGGSWVTILFFFSIGGDDVVARLRFWWLFQ